MIEKYGENMTLIDETALSAFERLEITEEGLPRYTWVDTDAAIDDAGFYGHMAERNLWAVAAVCHSLDRVAGPGRGNSKGNELQGDVKKFCAELGMSRSRVSNLSRAYELASHFIKDFRQRKSFNLLSLSHFEEASVLEKPEEAIGALEWSLDNGVNGSASSRNDLRRHIRGMRSAKVKESGAAVDGIEGETEKRVKQGQVWHLGRHTLYCGDTSGDSFASLCSRAALAFADPPYNAGVAEWDTAFVWAHDYLDELADVTVVTPGISSIFDFARITKMPYKWSLACWITNGMTRGALGFGNWIYAAVFSQGSVYRQGQDFYRVTINNSETDESDHRGRKPAAFVGWLIETFTKESDVVIDPFLGSGTTLLMAETMGRTCIGGEINPDYCSQIISRYEEMTGQKAEAVEVGHV